VFCTVYPRARGTTCIVQRTVCARTHPAAGADPLCGCAAPHAPAGAHRPRPRGHPLTGIGVFSRSCGTYATSCDSAHDFAQYVNMRDVSNPLFPTNDPLRRHVTTTVLHATRRVTSQPMCSAPCTRAARATTCNVRRAVRAPTPAARRRTPSAAVRPRTRTRARTVPDPLDTPTGALAGLTLYQSSSPLVSVLVQAKTLTGRAITHMSVQTHSG
jgi:hypothetical protein